jgi:glyoxylase-like metal-dependent hydrolase (beta-lactamase superfamily II)
VGIHGDGWAWLPKEKILFSGDACVNGPYNFVGDGEIREWMGTLAKARKLDPKTVGPGHGPLADGSVLADQQAYFEELSRLVAAAKSQVKTATEMEVLVPALREVDEKGVDRPLRRGRLPRPGREGLGRDGWRPVLLVTARPASGAARAPPRRPA